MILKQTTSDYFYYYTQTTLSILPRLVWVHQYITMIIAHLRNSDKTSGYLNRINCFSRFHSQQLELKFPIWALFLTSFNCQIFIHLGLRMISSGRRWYQRNCKSSLLHSTIQYLYKRKQITRQRMVKRKKWNPRRIEIDI